MSDFPNTRVEWKSSHRLVSSRFPPRGLFDRVAEPGDLEAAIAVESLTNERLRDEVGDITLVPPEERLTGPGATPVMAAFTHTNPNGSRFSDGSFGVYYAGRERRTALRETVYHRERFLAESSQPPMTIELREYLADVRGELRDLRGSNAAEALLDPDSYSVSRSFGRCTRHEGAQGIVYPSVRDPEGECVAVFRPRALGPARQGKHFGYCWDGVRITDIIELRTSHVAPHA